MYGCAISGTARSPPASERGMRHRALTGGWRCAVCLAREGKDDGRDRFARGPGPGTLKASCCRCGAGAVVGRSIVDPRPILWAHTRRDVTLDSGLQLRALFAPQAERDRMWGRAVRCGPYFLRPIKISLLEIKYFQMLNI
jgi:hypothetical protein